jgi:putative acetyltransferase
MPDNQPEIVKYKDDFKQQLTLVWEKSVRATHHFLLPEDIAYFKEVVANIAFSTFPVYCLVDQNKAIGFIGVVNRKIEMLFLSPEYIGKGLGSTLATFAIEKLQADQVDVNEQNTSAVHFYSRLGFKTYKRLKKDSEGKNYPILKMRLNKS